ncbi:MAG: hypothetical protein ACI9KN_001196 [Gammaproteobacteria bacterium]|jgi:hypothetical protein
MFYKWNQRVNLVRPEYVLLTLPIHSRLGATRIRPGDFTGIGSNYIEILYRTKASRYCGNGVRQSSKVVLFSPAMSMVQSTTCNALITVKGSGTTSISNPLSMKQIAGWNLICQFTPNAV